MSRRATLNAEFTSDPETIGWGPMTDVARHAEINTKNRTVDVDFVNGAEIYGAMDQAEYSALGATATSQITELYTLQGDITADKTARPATVLLAIFGAGTQTRTNLTALLEKQVTRGEELGLGENVTLGEVIEAR